MSLSMKISFFGRGKKGWFSLGVRARVEQTKAVGMYLQRKDVFVRAVLKALPARSIGKGSIVEVLQVDGAVSRG